MKLLYNILLANFVLFPQTDSNSFVVNMILLQKISNQPYEDKYAERLNIESVTDVRIIMKRSTPKLKLQVRDIPNEYQMETILSWQPLHEVYRAVPFLVKRFIRKCSQSYLLDPSLLDHLTEAVRKLN